METGMGSPSKSLRRLVLCGVALSFVILIPGLFLPVLTVKGTLNPGGVSDLANKILEEGLTESAIKNFRPILNPAMLPLLESGQGGLKGAIVTAFGNQLSTQLKSSQPIEVYSQTRSIVGSVRHLYSVGSNTAATLILFFSIIVPLTKSLLVSWAVMQSNPSRRRRTLFFVEAIAKWSMADVFAVAVMIAYLAAQASQSAGGNAAVVQFDASFGSGFYWFAAYCLTSLAVQQISARWLMKSLTPQEPS
jgi:Paraquat-inducible protein A